MTAQDELTVPADTSPQGRDRLRQLATDARVIRVVHPDLFGRQRAKQFPATHLEMLFDGVGYSKVSLAEDLLGVPVSATEFPALAQHPDLLAKVDPETALVPPWEPDAVWVLAHLVEGDRPSALCARSATRRAVRLLDEQFGISAITACEPEFYLFENGGSTAYGPDGVSYTVGPTTDPSGAVGRIHRHLIDFGIGVTAVNREFSPGQFEINLHHNQAEIAADQVFLLKAAIKELAIVEGLSANFMAKPITGAEGSSLHLHVSMWSGGDNVFATVSHGLSEHALCAIAGIQQHAPALLSFAAPTVNSYRRFAGNGLSPRTSSWGLDDRFAFVRVPAERGGATRLEIRVGDASASPHLLTAAVLHAMRDGIARQLSPSAQGEALPQSLPAALDALKNDEFLTDAMGDELIAVYTAIKRAEIRHTSEAVTDVEWELYGHHA